MKFVSMLLIIILDRSSNLISTNIKFYNNLYQFDIKCLSQKYIITLFYMLEYAIILIIVVIKINTSGD